MSFILPLEKTQELIANTMETTKGFSQEYSHQEYDAFISLGSSCFVAAQLTFRWLRAYSLPFDYLFNPSNNHIKIISRCLLNGFKNFFLYENLCELIEPEERGTGEEIQYQDTYTQFRFIHHFQDYKENNNEYLRVKEIFLRRIERLYYILENADRVLLLSDSGINNFYKDIRFKDLALLYKITRQLFPKTDIDIHYVHFVDNIDNQLIEINHYNNITLCTCPKEHLCRNSYLSPEYSLQKHVMYNGLSLSTKGIDLAQHCTKYKNI